MSECDTCAKILSTNGGGWKCKLIRSRKYIIGIVIGAVVTYVLIKVSRK